MTTTTTQPPRLRDPGVEFDPDQHAYYTSNNGTRRQLPGTTSVTDLLDKSAPLCWWSVNEMRDYLLEKWEPGETYDEVEIQRLLDEGRKARFRTSEDAKTVGNLVHEWIERYVNFRVRGLDEEPPFPENETVQESLIEFLDWVDHHEIEWLASERIVADLDLGFAGTFDLLAQVDGKLTIVEFKTSSGIYPAHLLQASAYALGAQRLLEGAEIDGFLIARFPKKEGAAFEVYSCYDREEIRAHLRGFRGLLSAYRWKQGYGNAVS